MYIQDASFSLWCDFIERDFIENGLRDLIAKGVINGATSNPAIFKNAFLHSPAYTHDIHSLQGKHPKEIYETLAIKDIKTSADLLMDLYKQDDDGFISIEVDPSLCDDMQGTITEGKKLFNAINRANVMIKVPATKAGFEAMQVLISEGINVNATLIFSPDQAKGCLHAFEEGTKTFVANHPNVKVPQAVISVFVSRFDRKMDAQLFSRNIRSSILGIFNATKIYHLITKSNLNNVRTLFASTGVKGDTLVKDYYITNLLFANSINTAPLETIDAFVKTGIKKIRKPLEETQIDEFFEVLKNQEIDIDKVYDELMTEGLEAFKIAFKDILKELEKG